MESRAWSFTQISQMQSRDLSTQPVSRCLPGCILEGSWEQRWSQDSNLAHPHPHPTRMLSPAVGSSIQGVGVGWSLGLLLFSMP